MGGAHHRQIRRDTMLRKHILFSLFLFSYSPLFFILSLKYWSVCEVISFSIFDYQFKIGLWAIIFLACIGMGVFSWVAVDWNTKNGQVRKNQKVISVEDRTKDALGYIVPYMIAFLGFNLCDWKDIISFILLMWILYSIYISSDMIFVNPVLTSIGKYKIYRVILKDGTCVPISEGAPSTYEVVLITKREKQLKKDDTVNIVYLGNDDVYKEVVVNGKTEQ